MVTVVKVQIQINLQSFVTFICFGQKNPSECKRHHGLKYILELCMKIHQMHFLCILDITLTRKLHDVYE